MCVTSRDVSCVIQRINNEFSSQEQSTTLKVSETVTTTESFEHAAGVSVMAGTEFSCGVPALAEGKVSLEVTANYEFTYGTSKEISRTIEHEYPCKVAPFRTVKCEALLYEYDTEVGYTMRWRHKRIPECACETSGVLRQLGVSEMWYKVEETDREKHETVQWYKDEAMLV